MKQVPFTLRVQTLNESLIGRWLCLDGLLDIALELQGVAPADRVLPLSGWDGAAINAPGTYSRADYEAGKVIAMGSAVQIHDPQLTSREFIQSLNRLSKAERLPCISDAGNEVTHVDTNRKTAVALKNGVQTVAPSIFEWEGHGDPEAAAALIESLPGLGAKTAQGWGRFERPVLIGGNDARLPGILSGDSSALLRPVPETYWSALGNAGHRLMIETVSAPYWKRQRAVSALVPSSGFADGILRIS